MDLIKGQQGASLELFQAQTHVVNQAFSFINSMSIKCAVQLGIPDIIYNHTQPITLPELVSALQIPPAKTSSLHQLMRVLEHSGIFARRKVHENQEEEGYVLTPSSRFLLKDSITSQLSFISIILDPVVQTPWHSLGDWFRGNEITAFETAHGMGFWDYGKLHPEFNNFFNEATASESQLMRSVVGDCQPIFKGLASLVDVGGGTGITTKIISEAFPHLKCTVFDLPHVVANVPAESNNLDYVGGDMFQSIPSANAILLKSVLHDWSNEECVKILKLCREAIPSKDEGGKVILIEIVIDGKNDDHELTETKLLSNMLMMVLFNGRERNEKEWEKLFLDAGFSHYKITPTFGLRSFIEVYP